MCASPAGPKVLHVEIRRAARPRGVLAQHAARDAAHVQCPQLTADLNRKTPTNLSSKQLADLSPKWDRNLPAKLWLKAVVPRKMRSIQTE